MASAAHPRRDGPGVGVLCPVPDGLSPGHGVGAAGFPRELPVAEANVVYYLLAATLVFLVFWTFLRHGFDLLLDWLPENLFAFGTGLVGAGCSICWSCSFPCRYRIPTRRATPSSLPSLRRPRW
ncbi:MAG: hypothetical protein ACLRWQ_11170 [Flavonifractor plautii]